MNVIIPEKADLLKVGGAAITVECRGAVVSSCNSECVKDNAHVVSELNQSCDCPNRCSGDE